MKLIIAGGRDYRLDDADYDKLDAIHERHPVDEVVSGGAAGADACGEFWAWHRGIPVKRFPADWATHGLRAGPIRNEAMAAYADAVALFPGGRGTENMRRNAVAAGIEIFNYSGGAK